MQHIETCGIDTCDDGLPCDCPCHDKELTMLDLHGATAQIQISKNGKTLWVNVDEVCRLRLCGAKRIEVEDLRAGITKDNF